MTKSAAILTVHDAPDMTDEGRDAIVRWLRREASFLKKYNHQLSKRYTTRYLYAEKRG